MTQLCAMLDHKTFVMNGCKMVRYNGMALHRAKRQSKLKSARESAERYRFSNMSFLRSSTRNGVPRSHALCGVELMSANALCGRMFIATKCREELNSIQYGRVRGSNILHWTYLLTPQCRGVQQ